MKAFGYILLLALLVQVCFAQTNAPPQPKTVHELPGLSDSAWRSIQATRGKKPLAVVTLTNDVSQNEILTVVDRVNVHHGIDGYIDGYCGDGARLNRHYLGRGSLVAVSFAWDLSPRKTIISLHGTNAGIAAVWCQDMTKALREKFGNTIDDGKKE